MKTRNSIRAEVNALYKERIIGWLSDSVKTKKPFEPVRIYLGAPTRDEEVVSNKESFKNFCEDWKKDLTAGKVDFLQKTYPEIGSIDVPIHLVFETIDEIASWAGHLVECHSALQRLQTLKQNLPDLIDSAIENIHAITSLDDADFSRFIQVCKWLCENKNSGYMIRQIPVRGVDTEWFEKHRFIILGFLRKYLDLNPIRRDLLQLGLVPPTENVRMVLLDKNLRAKVGSLRDIGVTLKDFAALDIKPRKVLFFDDLATALSIPDIPGVVIVVLPFPISEICRVPWVAHSQCAYISSIKMRSFAILNNIRVYLPNTQSLTLNKEFFVANSDIWSFDDIEIEVLNSSMALTESESILYNMLAAGVFGRRASLPLERVPLREIYALLDIEYQEDQSLVITPVANEELTNTKIEVPASVKVQSEKPETDKPVESSKAVLASQAEEQANLNS